MTFPGTVQRPPTRRTINKVIGRRGGGAGFVEYPADANAPGKEGQLAIRDDGNVLAICIAPNTWGYVVILGAEP